jgi:nicotinate phosphoribosyltransferase
MAAGYLAAGKAEERATFELFVRRLPARRDYLVVCGLEQALEYLEGLCFTGDEIDYLHKLPQFARVGEQFWEYLREFRFRGDVRAVAEGTVMFAGEPLMVVEAPLIEGQIPETYLLSTIGFQTIIASKASRIVAAAAGRSVVEFGCRRAHSPEAGCLGARAAFVGGCAGTSNVEAGKRFGVPVFGTAAHSWVLSFADEQTAFRQLQRLLGERTVQLIDTYDTVAGARLAASQGRPLWGVRLDSGDLAALARQVRAVLDAAGLEDVKIMATNDLDEDTVGVLVRGLAPIDVFGVGTSLATSFDAPALSAVYKLVEIEGRWTAKRSEGKATVPGAKQVYRLAERDVVALVSEAAPEGGEALLGTVMRQGRAVAQRRALKQVQEYAREQVERYGRAGRVVELSQKLKESTV